MMLRLFFNGEEWAAGELGVVASMFGGEDIRKCPCDLVTWTSSSPDLCEAVIVNIFMGDSRTLVGVLNLVPVVLSPLAFQGDSKTGWAFGPGVNTGHTGGSSLASRIVLRD